MLVDAVVGEDPPNDGVAEPGMVVTVMFGDWGGSLMDARTGTVNRTLLDHAAAYVAWLVGEKGYDCIRYYNLVNEPNGFWSAADGDWPFSTAAVNPGGDASTSPAAVMR